MIPRRIVALAIFVLFCTIAACTPATVAPGDPDPSGSATATPRLGDGIVRVALDGAPRRLGLAPRFASDPIGRAERVIDNLVMAQLVKRNDAGQPETDLAESVPTLANGGARFDGEGAERRMTVRFRLRSNARWSDGKDVTSADVVFSWQLARRPTGEGVVVDTAQRIERVTAIDDRTVAFAYYSHSSARAAAIGAPNRLGFLLGQWGPTLDPRMSYGLPDSWIYPRHLLGGGGADEPLDALLARTGFDRRPVGAGPYGIERWQGDEIRLRARTDFHGGKPTFPAIVARVTTPAERAIGLVNGQFDLAVFEGDDAAAGVGLQRAQGLMVDGPIPTDDEEVVRFNTASPALRDARIRRAILHAIDRRALAVDRFTERAASAALVEDAIGAVTRNDPERARQLLREAGWQIGNVDVPSRGVERPTLRLLTTADPARSRQAALIESTLAPYGIHVTPTRVAADALFAPGGPLARSAFDLAIYGVASTGDRLSDMLDRLTAESANRPDSRLTGLRARAEIALEGTERQAILTDADALAAERLFEARLYVYPRAIVRATSLLGPRISGSGIGITWNAARWARG